MAQFSVEVRPRTGEDTIAITIAPGIPPVVLTASEAKTLSRAIAEAVRAVKRRVDAGPRQL